MERNTSFDPDALIMLTKVIECRSITQAAIQLGRPKSTVSRKIARLESDLGVKLLRTSTRQITVTEVGQRIYEHALKIQSETISIQELVHSSKQEPQGLLKVTISVSIGVDFSSHIGLAFLKRYPKARLELQLVDRIVNPVSEGVDVAIQPGPLPDSGLVAKKIFNADKVLCASPEIAAQLPAKLNHPSQLKNVLFVGSGDSSMPLELTFKKGGVSYRLTPMLREKVNNFQIAKYHVLQGMGVGVLPRHLCYQELQDNKLVPILDQWALPPTEVYMVYSHRVSFSNLISAFYETICSRIEQFHAEHDVFRNLPSFEPVVYRKPRGKV